MSMIVVSVFENTSKNLVVQGRTQLEDGSHIVKGRCQGYMLTLQSLTFIERNNPTDGPLWN